MTRRTHLAATLVAMLALLPGCMLLDHHEPIVIPPGAQVVHVTVSDDDITLEPSTVRAGDVYFVNEGPNNAFMFLSSMPAPDAEPNSFTQAEIDRITGGDFQGIMWESFEVSCDRAWTQADHWRDCGENAYRILLEGLYIVAAGDEGPGAPPPMAVLEVSP